MSGLEVDHKKYKQYRNFVNSVKLHEKRVHYNEVFSKIGKNVKLLWNVVNGIVKKTANRSDIMELLYNNRVLDEPIEISNAFNSHFTCAGKHVQDSVSTSLTGDPCKFVKK